MSIPHVQIIVGDTELPDTLAAALRRVGATASFEPISASSDLGRAAAADAVVVVTSTNTAASRGRLEALLTRLGARPRGTLVLAQGKPLHTDDVARAGLPVSFGSALSEEELVGRLKTMIAMRPSLDALRLQRQATQRRDNATVEPYRRQLRLARAVQRQLLSQSLPPMGALDVSIMHECTESICGDVYDVHRINDTYAAVGLAALDRQDISAAMLSALVRRALRQGRNAPIVEPDEVLTRLHEDVLDATPHEPTTVAAVYALINVATGELQLAGAGCPQPLLRHADGSVTSLRVSQTALGGSKMMRPSVARVQLKPGDALLLRSNSLDGIGEACESRVPRRDSRIGSGLFADNRPSRTILPRHKLQTRDRFAAVLAAEGMPAALKQLRLRYTMLRRLGHSLADLSAISVSRRPAS